MILYADTSFLVSLYAIDANSEKASSCLARVQQPLAFTPFHRLELRNAIRLRAFRGSMDEGLVRAALRQIDEDLEDGILVHHPINWIELCRKADNLSEKHLGCRTLDLMHLSTALQLDTDKFLSFDQQQRELARLVGLQVAP